MSVRLKTGGRLGALLADARGVAAVEFALLLPLMFLFYFGAVELTQGVLAQQRASHTASTVGDLVAQSTSLTKAQVTDVFAVGTVVMYPYPTTSLGQRVSSLSEDAKGNVTVNWSQATGGMTALSKGASVSDPNLAKVLSTSQSVIVAESQYTYASAFSHIMPNGVTFNEKSYSRPRTSTQVTCADC